MNRAQNAHLLGCVVGVVGGATGGVRKRAAPAAYLGSPSVLESVQSPLVFSLPM